MLIVKILLFLSLLSAIIYILYIKLWLCPGSTTIPLYTKWGEELQKSNKTLILPEYPRPQFERNSYINLNGYWDYTITKDNNLPTNYESKILVPFPVGSLLSEVKDNLNVGEIIYYRKIFSFSNFKNQGKIIINFGAVDQICEVFINKISVGIHEGGYTPFSFDISKNIKFDKPNEIIVKVIDNLDEKGESFGKQYKYRGNIWYTPLSGIWQTVWIESVPETYLKSVKIKPLYDENSVEFIPDIEGEKNLKGKIQIFDENGLLIKESNLKNEKNIVKLPKDFKSWSPENPYLYNVLYTYGNDKVKSYFGMRKFSIGVDSKNIKRLFLNNKPYFHNGLLDQGYWSDGLYTPASYEAFIYDIKTMKNLGFNMLRKHIKIEPLIWYYYCDKLGMIVWQDMINGGNQPYNPFTILVFPNIGLDISDSRYWLFGRTQEEGRNAYYRDLKEMINTLHNVVSISTWTPFNEGWGQFDSLKAVEFIRNLDNSRYIDHASGWYDHKGGDFKSLHIYFKKLDINYKNEERAVVLSEFGGYSLTINGHLGSDKQFGYKFFDNKSKLTEALNDLFINQVKVEIDKGLSASVYTQVSDVEDEVNGLVTYDRKIVKVDEKIVKAFNNKIRY